MRDVSIVVVTYNSIDFIEECIKSIVTQTYKEFEIFIVDNNSQDNTVGFIRRYYPQVNLIENEELRKTLKKNARQKAIREFSAEKMAYEYEKVYYQVLEGRVHV